MAFPSPSLVAPTLTTWQFSYGGVSFGGIVQGGTYHLQGTDAIDRPDTISEDTQRALENGEFIGQDMLPGRDITVQQVIRATTDAGLDVARRTLAGAMGAAGTVEGPLYLQLASGTFACMARARRHHVGVDVLTVFGKAALATTMFHATDPRWYAAPTKTATVGLPGPLGGMTFPATFPLTFGGGGTGGVLSITNAGLIEMRPVLVVTGPCTNPRISNLTIAGAPTLSFNLTMAAGDTLVIDTDFQSVTYFTSGSSIGASRRGALVVGSTWFNLPPGLNQVQLTTTDVSLVAATLTVRSADAWIGL